MKSLTILDNTYQEWIADLSKRYRLSQIKAAVKVNREMLHFYWELGRDIVVMHAEARWGDRVIRNLSADLRRLNPAANCFSKTNLYYSKKFYQLYSPIVHQLDGQLPKLAKQCGESVHQADGQLPLVSSVADTLFSIPWGHHMRIIDKCGLDSQRAYFFVKQTIENGWSRDVLLNFLSSDLYNRQSKALSNFKQTLPEPTSDLAQEITKDPYLFGFTGITGRYNERILKDALLANITQFLIELGTGFAYVGKEYALKIGESEKFIDLLFYNLKLSCYVVIEVKIGKFDFADVGQLSGYVVACNHLLRNPERDKPTIGLLICKEKDRVQAQYALESSSQPIGISEYDLEKFYPEKIEGTIPSVKELEMALAKDNITTSD